MKLVYSVCVLAVLVATSARPVLAKKCPPDSVQVGTLCVDTYEASVWSIPAGSSLEDGAGDDGTTQCNTITAFDAVNTGSRSACKSLYGAFDMVGNVDEWVADAAIGPVVTM